MRFVRSASLVAAVGLLLGACGSGGSSAAGSDDGDKTDIKVGILSREEPEMREVQKYLETEGYNMTIEVFSDNVAMNRATEDGSLDANWFQHQSYLDSQIEEAGLKLKSYGPWLMTTATILVSSTYDSVEEMPPGSKVGLSEDAANLARSLQLMEDNGYIELSDATETPTLFDITENPYELEFVASNPRSMMGMYPDLDAMIATSISVYLMDDPDVKTLAAETAQVAGDYGGLVWTVAESSKPEDAKWLNLAIDYMESDTWRNWLEDYYDGLKMTP